MSRLDNLKIKTKDYKTSDIASFLNLEKSIWINNYSHILNLSPQNLKDRLDRIDSPEIFNLYKIYVTNTSDYKILTIYQESELIAFLLAKVNKDDIRLKKIYISPKYQGLGLGKKIINKILNLYKDKKISLLVFPENKKAINLYQKFGFKYLKKAEPLYISQSCQLKRNLMIRE